MHDLRDLGEILVDVAGEAFLVSVDPLGRACDFELPRRGRHQARRRRRRARRHHVAECRPRGDPEKRRKCEQDRSRVRQHPVNRNGQSDAGEQHPKRPQRAEALSPKDVKNRETHQYLPPAMTPAGAGESLAPIHRRQQAGL